MGFSKDFLWGAASAAHQVEGAYKEDGKGLSIWNHFEHEPHNIRHGETADVACDHYHRYQEDIALMKEIGLKSYRFSISWPRILPEGTGQVNQKGLEFYSRLVDELLDAGIEPMVTLYHWDLPYELYKKGGWENDNSPVWFEKYTRVVVERLSDRVKYWMTFNEPQIFLGLGFQLGVHAPFEKRDTADLIHMTKNVLLAHGKAVKVIRENGKQKVFVGMAPTGDVYLPKEETAEFVEEARRKSFGINQIDFLMSNSWWADPVFLGRYPKDAEKIFGTQMYTFTSEEWKLVSQPLDFYGYNNYQGRIDQPIDPYGYDNYGYQGCPKTTFGWNVTPDSLYWSSKFLYERYGKPILITENGYAGTDWVALDGKVHDTNRIDFVHRYLLGLKRAVEEGVPVLGYQYWSIMDNFEWSSGYDLRFGMIYVDYRTLKRTVKDSAYWYHDVIASNGDTL
jgi:beta-glucosidase